MYCDPEKLHKICVKLGELKTDNAPLVDEIENMVIELAQDSFNRGQTEAEYSTTRRIRREYGDMYYAD